METQVRERMVRQFSDKALAVGAFPAVGCPEGMEVISVTDHPGFALLPGYEWVPAREWLDDIAEKPDDYRLISADSSQEWTAGEIRKLATTGQAICVPRVLPHTGIWAVGS